MGLRHTQTQDLDALGRLTSTAWFALPVVPPIEFMAITAWDNLEDGLRTFTIYMTYEQSAVDAAWRKRGELESVGVPVIDEVLGTWRDGTWEEHYQEASEWPFADPDDMMNDTVGEIASLWTGGSFDAVRAAIFPEFVDSPERMERAWDAFMRGTPRQEASSSA